MLICMQQSVAMRLRHNTLGLTSVQEEWQLTAYEDEQKTVPSNCERSMDFPDETALLILTLMLKASEASDVIEEPVLLPSQKSQSSYAVKPMPSAPEVPSSFISLGRTMSKDGEVALEKFLYKGIRVVVQAGDVAAALQRLEKVGEWLRPNLEAIILIKFFF
jgi:hypothetical protein